MNNVEKNRVDSDRSRNRSKNKIVKILAKSKI